MGKHSFLIAIITLSALPALAQNASIGVAAPFTITGQSLLTQRAKAVDPETGNLSAAFRAVVYPTLKLGEKWFFYSALQVHSEPFFYYESYYPDREIETHLMQAFLGYNWVREKKAVNVKLGKLPSAFGSFPLRYDDTANPLLDQPLSYSSHLRIRPDALPCGVRDLPNLRPYSGYVGVRFYCGGSEDMSYGIPPVSLYGIPGIEMDFSLHKLDGRFQLTNSSPANPQSLLSESQHVQWTAGAGYTLWQGFRVGASAFRGPFLEDSVRERLPVEKGIRDYPATGIGADVQWARGRWSLSGEWHRFQFAYPRLIIPATVNSAYVEAKATLHPRFYAAVRASHQRHNRVADRTRQAGAPFQPNQQSYEFAVGYRLNRLQLLKVGYEWLRTQGVSGTRDNVLGVQFITSVSSFSKAIR